MDTQIKSLPRLNASFNKSNANSSLDASSTIVHLGVGAFHRAHQAWYTQKALETENSDSWKIIGVSLRSATMAEQLNPQNGLYTVVEQNSEGYNTQIIDVIKEVIVAPESPDTVLAVLSDVRTKIVSLTITEKGYCHDPASGQLHLSHPDIQHDLNCDLTKHQHPRSAIGYLVWAMHLRWQRNLSGFTVMSCDNLPANGQLLRNLVLSFAHQLAPDFAEHVATEYAFPSSMVDRIVPAMTEQVRNKFCQQLGYDDHGLIVTESFSQWVIEDNFAQDRPAWEKAGALLTQDVHAFETMKLRLLNGSHSSIAYVGYLSGFKTVAETIENPECFAFISAIMREELLPSVDVPKGIDVKQYCQQLLQRFANPHLHHQTYQIAMDGSQKLPQRLLHALAFQLDNQGSIDRLCFVIAAWIQYVSGLDLNGKEISVQDPYTIELASAYYTANGDLTEWVEEIFCMDTIFDQNVKQNKQVKSKVCYWLAHMREQSRACDSLHSLQVVVGQC
ncbi:mannitol dehydrogenase family protein [Glaciecola petra]|uniref:Mannitol dehydrogenase family protein n=1 Tax=Glaciecola petra TaxID=3075602 RepID=A0ABU2ZVL1_9ALTE|nr:mannitol dehydrogenase family protein [Aestuariibacter sp. P117]MDT0596276.1 mannitol dehydrogenase family protein [Aestuariibacter sp. P117]